MNNTIQINRERERDEALATALGHAMLKFLTIQVNILLAFCALVCLLAYHISGHHMDLTIVALGVWVLHLGIMLTVDIAKGGAEL